MYINVCSWLDALLYVGVLCRGDWTDVGELGGEWAGESDGGEDWEGWTGELVYLVSVCKRVFSVGFRPGWTQCLPQGNGAPLTMLQGRMTGFPQKTGGPGLRRGGTGGYNLHSPSWLWHTNHAHAVSVWCAIEYITALFNLSVTNCQIPAIWKFSLIIPIPKPGRHLPRIFISPYLASLTSRISPGDSDSSHYQHISPTCTWPTRF